jgi:hypothetical protein
VKTADQAANKWTSSTGTGQATWLANLEGTSKPIAAAAVAARDRLQQNFQAATAPGGRWERNLLAVGDAGIKAAAAKKAGNYSTGIANGKENFAAAIAKVIAYEQAGMAGLNAIPKGGLGQSKARANYWIDYMAAGRGRLGAK